MFSYPVLFCAIDCLHVANYRATCTSVTQTKVFVYHSSGFDRPTDRQTVSSPLDQLQALSINGVTVANGARAPVAKLA